MKATQTASKASQFTITMAKRYGIDEGELFNTLAKTAFRQKSGEAPTHEQMTALLVVANEYGLNPFTKEIFAFDDRGAVIPVVGVDGWIKIINSQKQYAGVEFVYSSEYVIMPKAKVPAPQWIECWIYRNDLEKPVKVREFLDETYRTGKFDGPWQTHPKRMLRHKALVQASRVAFGFSNIYDQDEAEVIVSRDQPHDQEGMVEVSHSSQNGLPNLSDHDKAQLDAKMKELINQCVAHQSFAPGKAWIASQDQAEQAYLMEQLAQAEQEWKQEQSIPASAEQAVDQAPQAPAISPQLNDAVVALVHQCRKAGSYRPGYRWIENKLSLEADIQFATAALQAAEAEDCAAQSAA